MKRGSRRTKKRSDLLIDILKERRPSRPPACVLCGRVARLVFPQLEAGEAAPRQHPGICGTCATNAFIDTVRIATESGS